MAGTAARSRLDDENWAGMKLWYTQPAEKWTEALPVGNGRLGAMIFGGAAQERLPWLLHAAGLAGTVAYP